MTLMGRGRGGRVHGRYCDCRGCRNQRDRAEQEYNERQSGGGWSPRVVGTTDDDREVTLREGLGANEGHTLIADGTPSGRAFDRRGEHNHYGDRREGDGRVEDGDGDRGYYTGPGH